MTKMFRNQWRGNLWSGLHQCIYAVQQVPMKRWMRKMNYVSTSKTVQPIKCMEAKILITYSIKEWIIISLCSSEITTKLWLMVILLIQITHIIAWFINKKHQSQQRSQESPFNLRMLLRLTYRKLASLAVTIRTMLWRQMATVSLDCPSKS